MTLVLCGEPSGRDNWEPCPQEKDHDGAHVFWQQTRPHSKRARNGVWVVEADGTQVLHATFDGAVTSEEVCALLVLRELAAKQMGADDG